MTRENAHLYLPLVQALADGREIEWQYDADGNEWVHEARPTFGFTPGRYRIKPDPVLVPLGPEDVPPGSVFRKHVWHNQSWNAPTRVHRDGVNFDSHDFADWMALMRDYQIKRPGEDWMPCSKPNLQLA